MIRSLRWRLQAWHALVLLAMLVLFGFVAAILTDAADALRVMGEIESALPGRQTAGR